GTAAGSTTSGGSGGGALVVGDTAGRAIMSGTPWQAAVIVGALLIFAAGLATAMRGQDWPVMSARYDAPGARDAAAAGGAAEPGAAEPGAASQRKAGRPADAASMWESLNGGEDPTEDDQADSADAATRR
ncbi:MAG TPA: Trp biosynthesis-associated membrane protein, partial [Trebonia sp.]